MATHLETGHFSCKTMSQKTIMCPSNSSHLENTRKSVKKENTISARDFVHARVAPSHTQTYVRPAMVWPIKRQPPSTIQLCTDTVAP